MKKTQQIVEVTRLGLQIIEKADVVEDNQG